MADSAGARVLIHRVDQQPFPEDEGFSVVPGMQTSISLHLVNSSLKWIQCDTIELFEKLT